MRTFSQKQPQKPIPAIPARSNMATSGPANREHPIFHLQRTIGNQAVLRMLQTHTKEPGVGLTDAAALRFGHDFSQIPIHSSTAGAIQTKLAINEPGDEYEQEAERISGQVMRMPEPQFQRTCACGGGCPKCQTGQPVQKHERLQAKLVGSGDVGPTVAPPIVHEVLHSPGQPLDAATRAFMEPRFGYDFSGIRLHRSAPIAHQSAREVDALAYTVRHNIVFSAGRFAPETQDGRRLIAHELTHVVQQSGGGLSIQRAPAAGNRWERDENAARYRGQMMAKRIRIHTKLSKEARAKINSELEYFVGAAKEAYLKEVKPALLEVNEIEMTGKEGTAEPLNTTTHDPAMFFNRMLSNPNYIDNNMTEINYYTAELATIHYKDGSKLDLGLVSKWMKPPFVEVDYHTPRADYRPLLDPKGNVSFFRESDLQNVPRGMPWGEVQKRYAKPVTFSAEGGRIVPSRVNMLTAPNLCKVLLDSEARFQQQVDLAVELGMGMLKVLQLQTMNPLMGGGMAGAGRVASGSAVRVGAGAAAKGLGGAATKEALTFVEIGAGDLKAAIEVAKTGGVKVIAVDTAAPAAAAVQELQGVGGQFVKGVAADLAPNTADHVFQYFPWRITGTGRWLGGGTFRLVDDTMRLLKPNGAAHFVTEELETAKFLAAEASQRGLKAVITKTTAGVAAPGATGAGVKGFAKGLAVWMVNIYK